LRNNHKPNGENSGVYWTPVAERESRRKISGRREKLKKTSVKKIVKKDHQSKKKEFVDFICREEKNKKQFGDKKSPKISRKLKTRGEMSPSRGEEPGRLPDEETTELRRFREDMTIQKNRET